MLPRFKFRRFQPLSLLMLVACLGADCSSTGETGDAGDPEPVCEGGETQTVAPGFTGLDYVAMENGDAIASWPRPQGGIGTRINVRIDGLPTQTNFSSLTVFMTKPVETPSDVPGEEGGPCIDTEEESEKCITTEDAPELSCIEDTCILLVAEQVNRQFPVECQQDGALLVPELPVRYRSQLSLEDIDEIDADLTIFVTTYDEQEITSTPVRVSLEVGDFIEPSWWQTLD